MQMDEKYDTALLGILQHEGKIEKFLDVVLGFLYRRTDFYRLMKSKDDRLGFPPGVALQMLATTYKKYDDMAVEAEKMREEQREQRERIKAEQVSAGSGDKDTTKEQATDKSNEESLSAIQNVEKTEEVIAEEGTIDTSNSKGDTVTGDNETKEVKDETVIQDQDQEVADSKVVDGADADVSDTVSESKKPIDPRTGEEDDDPELTRQQKVFQDDPESYNGARRDHFRWAQSINDLDLRINVAAHIKKGRDCRVTIDKKHVKVEYKDTSGGWTVAVNGDLTWEVHKDESVWSLVPGDHIHGYKLSVKQFGSRIGLTFYLVLSGSRLVAKVTSRPHWQINFEKKEERWWESFFTDEPKISVRKIDASRPMSDLDDEAQAKIAEMMYNDRQKKLGRPQTHEEKMHTMLKRAWDAEGSPFKGQPFDPSKCSVDPSGIMHFKR